MSLKQGIDSQFQIKEVLLDGRSVLLRVIHPEDKAILEDEFRHLSPESVYFRFFTAKKYLTKAELAFFSELDLVHHVGLVASILEDGKEVPAGAGRYIVCRESEDKISAELAFEVREEFQGLGIATLLLKELVEIGRGAGIDDFIAYVLCDNKKMIAVFNNSGLPFTTSLLSGGVTKYKFPIGYGSSASAVTNNPSDLGQ